MIIRIYSAFLTFVAGLVKIDLGCRKIKRNFFCTLLVKCHIDLSHEKAACSKSFSKFKESVI